MNQVQRNEEIIQELRKRISNNEETLNQLSHKLKERNKELNCLYSISSFKEDSKFTLEDKFRELVELIPQGCFYPESVCVKIFFEGYEFKSNNFQDSEWNLSQEIMIFNERVGIIEVCYTGKVQKISEDLFNEEKKKLINAITERIARIIEREWAETEIRRSQNKIATLMKPN